MVSVGILFAKSAYMYATLFRMYSGIITQTMCHEISIPTGNGGGVGVGGGSRLPINSTMNPRIYVPNDPTSS